MLEENRSARLEARLPPSVYSLLKEAADLQGRSVSDFVVASAREAAEQAIARHGEISLSMEAQKRFVEALINPPAPAPALRQAIADRERLLDQS